MSSKSVISWCGCDFCQERNRRIRSGVSRVRQDGPSVVKEIRRDNQRILKAGANVYVQPTAGKGHADMRAGLLSVTPTTQ